MGVQRSAFSHHQKKYLVFVDFLYTFTNFHQFLLIFTHFQRFISSFKLLYPNSDNIVPLQLFLLLQCRLMRMLILVELLVGGWAVRTSIINSIIVDFSVLSSIFTHFHRFFCFKDLFSIIYPNSDNINLSLCFLCCISPFLFLFLSRQRSSED